MAGDEIRCDAWPNKKTTLDERSLMTEMIRTSGLVKRFGKVTTLDGLDLAVPRGTILGLLGPNGAGKTTVVRIRTAVVLPAPLGPSNPRIVLRGTAKSSPSSVVTFPNRFTSPDVRIISVMRLLSSSVVFLLGQASQRISSPAISGL